jgi:hypothetical protein
LDGVLGNLQWFEKRIHPDLKAAALLFQWQLKPLEPVDPAFFYKDCDPFRGFRQDVRRPNLFEKMVRAWRTTASLKRRMVDGQETAAMVYDQQPIVDYFRRIDDNEVAGMMVVDVMNEGCSGSGVSICSVSRLEHERCVPAGTQAFSFSPRGNDVLPRSPIAMPSR